MACAGVVFATPLCSGLISISHTRRRPTTELPTRSSAAFRIRCSSSSSEAPPEKLITGADFSVTGGAYDFTKATISLTNELISSSKKVTLIRHGLSTWNAESRLQGSSDLSILTEIGEKQAERCKKALENIYFDQCFASPISRAKRTAEIIWQGREKPLVFLDSLKEISLYHLEGMKNGKITSAQLETPRNDLLQYCYDKVAFVNINLDRLFFIIKGALTDHQIDHNLVKCFDIVNFLTLHVPNLEAADAKKIYPKEYTAWREDPANLYINGRFPIRDLWGAARDAWKDILLTPGESFLIVTHKSILRALTCTALGLEPERFRAIDVNNGGICIFNFNIRGEAMLQALNMTAHMTAHMYSDHVYPG